MEKVFIIFIAIIFALVIGPLFVMLGWHLFMVPVYHMPMITFWQAFGFGCLIGSTGAIVKHSAS